ncbi:MAG: caspase family protein [Calditrichaeota bacterium]|nr:caspase family protein [Calditrichota bacterium]
MSLFFPTSGADIVTDMPRLHALVIGVDAYDHLGLGVPKPSNLLSGLAPLTIAVPSARNIARWLENAYHNPDCPLGSIELLLAPGEILKRKDGSDAAIDKSTMANIETAAAAWYQRCNANPKNIAFFYFAGHGISTVVGRYILPADFGNPDLPDDWKNCIDAGGLQVGMNKCKAQHQYFFLDACRDAPVEALLQKKPHGNPLIGGADNEDNVELSAEYAAASEGRQAFGKDGGGTFFSEALIMCLNGMGANQRGGKKIWRVDAASLSYGLANVMELIAERENLPLSCDCRMQKPVSLHFPALGQVLVRVNCLVEGMQHESNITLTQGNTVKNSPPGGPRPWIESAISGDATISVKYTNFPDETIKDSLLPPVYDLELPYE